MHYGIAFFVKYALLHVLYKINFVRQHNIQPFATYTDSSLGFATEPMFLCEVTMTGGMKNEIEKGATSLLNKREMEIKASGRGRIKYGC